MISAQVQPLLWDIIIHDMQTCFVQEQSILDNVSKAKEWAQHSRQQLAVLNFEKA